MFTSYKGRTLGPFHKVKVYRNLHKPGVTFSVQDASTGLVIGHSTSILLSNVTFEVSQRGREKVVQEKKKNVHAFVTGFYAGPFYAGDRELFSKGAPVSYNPYKAGHFYYKSDDSPIHSANLTLVDERGVFVS